jgi:hypothetical protein
MAELNAFIGFPEGWLRDKPVRLTVLANEPDWFAVNKLASLLGQAHPWFAGQADITAAIRSQAEAGKGELERLGISGCYYIYGPEFETPGPLLFAKNKSSANLIKNAIGSDQICFTHLFLTEAKVSESELICELPVAIHKDKPVAVVSHRFGKKSSTRFRKIKGSETLSLWEAATTHPRMNQIRLHAAELGIPILGDADYGRMDRLDDRRENRGFRLVKPRFSGVAMFLSEIDLSRILPEYPKLEVEPSRQFASLLRKCGLQ